MPTPIATVPAWLVSQYYLEVAMKMYFFCLQSFIQIIAQASKILLRKTDGFYFWRFSSSRLESLFMHTTFNTVMVGHGYPCFDNVGTASKRVSKGGLFPTRQTLIIVSTHSECLLTKCRLVEQPKPASYVEIQNHSTMNVP